MNRELYPGAGVLKQLVVSREKSLHVWSLLSVFSGLYDGSSGVHCAPEHVSSPSTVLQCDNTVRYNDNDYGLALHTKVFG